MEYNSFYGGRQGASFIIAASFKTVALMEAALSDPDYKTVAYNEYAIIDTDNKNNVDNGKIYRRIENAPGYEYIGQIVGPSGHAPLLEMGSYNEVSQMTGAQTKEMTVNNGDLIKGKDGNVYNDKIRYTYCSVRDAEGRDTVIYFGFKIPYTIIDVAAEKVTPYTTDLTPSVSGTDHPFYKKWTFKIPQGIKGDAFQNFRILVPDANTSYNDATGNAHILYKDKSYLVYDYYSYNRTDDPDPVTLYLGEYNMIDSITEQDGVVTIKYTHDDDQNLITIKYITSIALTTATGKMVVTYNTKNNGEYEKDTWVLPYVVGAALSQQGTFTYKVANGSSTPTTKTQSAKLTWVENARVQATGELDIKYNTAATNTWTNLATIKYIDHMEITSDGHLNVYYNTDPNTPEELDVLTYIHHMELTAAGSLNVYYNTDPTTPVNLGTIEYVIAAQVTYDGNLQVKYNTNNAWVTLTNIKYISKISGSAGYLKIDYNNGDASTYTWQGTTNSTGALIATETLTPPEPNFAEGSPWFIVEEIVPYNRELNYIESTGTQYINLDIPCQTGVKVEMKFSFTEGSTVQHVFGTRVYEGLSFGYGINSSNTWTCNLIDDGGRYVSGAAATVNRDYEVEMYLGTSNQYFMIDGVKKINLSQTVPEQISSYSLYLFKKNVDSTLGTTPAKIKLYYCKVYINNTLVQDLIPVLDKQNIPCLYDEISERFLYNAGTGTFLYNA